jgi:tetratricopeptide (TPR) repeat protein
VQTMKTVAMSLILLLAGSGVALARDDVQSAREHFLKGKRAYDLGRFTDAAKEYEAAYEQKDDPALLFNIGQAHRLAGPAHARASLLAYKAFLRNVPNPPNQLEVEAHIREMQAVVDQQAGEEAAAARAEAARKAETHKAEAAAAKATPVETQQPSRSDLIVRPADKPLVKKPWFWAVIGVSAAVVATGVALTVVYAKPSDPTPSWGSVGGP